MPFCQFFRKGWNRHALLVRPSKSNQILFVLGSHEYLEKLESAYSFMLKYSKIKVCTVTAATEIKEPEETFTKTEESTYEKPIEVYDFKPVTDIGEEKSSNGMKL